MKRIETGYKKYITDKEFDLFKTELDNTKNPSLQMALKLLCLGLRVGEVVELKRQHFSPDFTTITYTLEKSHNQINKSGRPHTRQIPKELAKEIEEFYHKYTKHREKWQTDYIFFPWGRTTPNPKPHLTCSSIRSWFIRFRRKNNLDQVYYTCRDGKGLRRISPHTLRHRAAYKFFKASQNNIIAARDIIGHKKTSTTAAYCYAWDARENETKLVELAGLI